MLTEVIILLLGILLIQQPSAADRDRDVQRIAMEGWRAARAIAPKGGASSCSGPVNVRLKELDEIPKMSARYAETAIRAAVSRRRKSVTRWRCCSSTRAACRT
jgi:hypothetical protein